MSKVNLKNCKKGDILISKHGAILEYLEELPEEDYFDVKVKYLFIDGEINKGKLGEGTRTFEGETFRKKKLETDHDIVAVIDRKELIKLLKNA